MIEIGGYLDYYSEFNKNPTLLTKLLAHISYQRKIVHGYIQDKSVYVDPFPQCPQYFPNTTNMLFCQR